MPPRRAAALKAAAANTAAAQPSSSTAAPKPASKAKAKPASKAKAATGAKKGRKRAAPDDDDDEDKDVIAEDAEEEEDVKPKSKKAKIDKTEDADDVKKDDEDKVDGMKDDDAKKDDATVDDKEDAKADKDKEDEKPAKMVTIVKRGNAVPVDPHSPYVATHQVYVNPGGEIFDAMLNQTDIKKNSNKFYVLQLLQDMNNPTSAIQFTRWGRVGEVGQTQIKGPFPPAQGEREFYKQYKSKTGSDWSMRKNMVPKAGKYIWIERDFTDDDEKEKEAEAEGSGEGSGEANGESKGKERAKTPDCQAEPEVQNLIKLIFNTQLMDAHLKELNYDANKLPLGKMSKSHILNGFSTLKTLSDVIDNPNGATAAEYGGFDEACQRLSGNYYSIIPHLFSRTQRPITINTKELLKRELDLVDALSDMTISSKIIQSSSADSSGDPVHPIDSRLKGLNLDYIHALDSDSKEFKALEQYAKDTHGSTHGHLNPKVETIFKLERNGEPGRFNEAGFDKIDDGHRMLLWHGSRTTNFGGILSQGLRIAPPEAPVSGYMFGKGVYFADAASKSLGYTYSHLSNNTGLLLLCEVATKPFIELGHATYDADQHCKKAGANATKGVGKIQPLDWQDVAEATGNEELKGVVMPKGPIGEVKHDKGGHLWYNEYIVYDTTQVRLRYLLKFNVRGY